MYAPAGGVPPPEALSNAGEKHLIPTCVETMHAKALGSSCPPPVSVGEFDGTRNSSLAFHLTFITSDLPLDDAGIAWLKRTLSASTWRPALLIATVGESPAFTSRFPDPTPLLSRSGLD